MKGRMVTGMGTATGMDMATVTGTVMVMGTIRMMRRRFGRRGGGRSCLGRGRRSMGGRRELKIKN